MCWKSIALAIRSETPRLDDGRLADVFAREVSGLLVDRGLLSWEWVDRILSWRHTGFNVHSRVRARTKLEAERALRQRPSGESQEGEQICGR